MTSVKEPEKDSNRRELGGQFDTADYVAEICAELGRLARGEGLDTLAYILDMARLEAESITQQSKSLSK